MYKVFEHDVYSCSCFKCAERKKEIVFRDNLKKITQSMGFIPRNYDVSIGYNSWEYITHKIKSNVNVEVLSANINGVIQHNSSIIKGLTKRAKLRYTYCYDCGKYHEFKPQHEVETKRYVCQACFNSRYFICQDCGKLQRKELALQTSDKFICHDCYEIHYSKCTRCGRVELKHSFKKVKSTQGNGHTYVGEIGKDVCGKCYKAFVECSVCGFSFPARDGYINSNYVCASCQKLSQYKLNQWEFKPIPIFWVAPTESINTQSLMIGVELEVQAAKAAGDENKIKVDTEAGSRIVKLIGKFQKILGEKYAYCKTDSSVKKGFEIITHPFTWDFYKMNTNRWVEFLKWAGNNDVTVDDTCGVHVHLSKRAFSTCHLYRFVNFFYRLENRDFIYKISQRTNMEKFKEYCPFLKDDEARQVRIAKNKFNTSEQRHSAVNLMCPETVEVRIFEARLEPHLFFKNIEFCHAAFEFTKNTEKFDTHYKKFFIFVQNKQKEYPNLYRFLTANYKL